MKILVPLAAAGFILSTAAVHPQPYDRGAPLIQINPPALIEVAPPPLPEPPPRRMICVIDTPFPNHAQHCETRPGYPGSPCRCEGSLFEGERAWLD